LDEISKILETAEVMFRKYGIRSVTMSDIARKLGVSKKTLYRHIENKHDLVSKIMERYIEQERSMCMQIAKEATNALEELVKVSIYVQHQVQDINPSLIYDLQKYHRPIWELIDNFHQDFIVVMAESNLERGVKEGLYRKDLHIKLIAKLYVSLIPVISDDERFPLKVYPTHVVHKEFIKYHINGIVSEKGRSMLVQILEEQDIKREIL